MLGQEARGLYENLTVPPSPSCTANDCQVTTYYILYGESKREQATKDDDEEIHDSQEKPCNLKKAHKPSIHSRTDDGGDSDGGRNK